MQGNAEALAMVPGVLLKTLSADKTQRQEAEQFLKKLYGQPGCAMLFFQIIEMHATGPAEPDISIRQAAAVSFKNLVRTGWESKKEEGEAVDAPSMAHADKDMVKQHILNLMCLVPNDVQKQLSEALTIISSHDFPDQWPGLLPEMVAKFSSQDFHVINGVLRSANAIFKRFRYAFKSDALFAQLLFCLQNFAAPLTELFTWAEARLEEAAKTNDKPRLLATMETLRLCCRIFFSLNWQDLPEFFEDNMAPWMSIFAKLLRFRHPLLVDESEEDKPGPLEAVRAAVVENVNLYATKYEEEFQPHLNIFATAVWELLETSGTTGALPKYDALVTVSMRFLASLAGKQMHYALFNNPTLLRQILEAIVVPNVTMREDEEYMFEDNPTEYIQRDMEGSDQDTRRRCSSDLVRALCQQFDADVTRIGLEYIGNMLNLYQSNPSNWKSKDAAIQLMLAITVRGESAAKGASIINDKVDVMAFYTAHILPELEDPALDARPILKADGLKFVTVFRQQFSVQALLAVMPLLIKLLGSAHAVVQTYAAHCLERILNVKDRNERGGPTWVRRLGKEALRPSLNGLFTGLFAVVDRGGADGQENEYVMKAIMRLLTVVQDEILPVTGIVLERLTASLVRVCRNPSNPLFNHFLFESLAATVKFICQANPHATADFEERLMPPFEGVLSLDVAEFTPYVFQILAQLLLYRPDGLSPAFVGLFPPLLTASLWERKANIPGLVLLLQAYLKKGPETLSPHIEPLLGIFSNLLSYRVSEKYAFDLLLAVFTNISSSILSKYERRIFELIFTRLQTSKSPRTVRSSLLFFGFYTGKFSPEAWVHLLESLQSGMTRMVLTQVWIPNVQMAAIAGGMEAKACVVGLTRVTCEYRELLGSAEGLEIWGGLLKGVVCMATPEADKDANSVVGKRGGGDEGIDEEDAWEKQQAVQEVSGEAVFSKLHFASAGDEDYFPEVGNPLSFVAQRLNTLLASNPGVNLWQIVEKSLSQQQVQTLQAAGVRF